MAVRQPEAVNVPMMKALTPLAPPAAAPPATVPSAAAHAYPAPAYAWYVVAVLTVAYVSSFIDRQILSLLVVPIRRDLGISDT